MATTTKVKVTPYVDWSAIIAGTLIAAAVTGLLAHFGAALGYTYEQFAGTEATNSEELWHHFIILTLWTLWTALMASMAGGYTAGRTRRGLIGNNSEAEIRDGAHGLLTWAVGAVITGAAAAIAAFWASLDPTPAAEIQSHLTADQAEKMALIWAFSMTAMGLVSAVTAWWMGTIGGDHRDRGPDVSSFISFRGKKR